MRHERQNVNAKNAFSFCFHHMRLKKRTWAKNLSAKFERQNVGVLLVSFVLCSFVLMFFVIIEEMEMQLVS